MLVSPTEPAIFRRTPARTSSLPETYGVDFLWAARGAWWGVQRKEVKDLLASLEDGRLAKELGQMHRVQQAVLVVEGTMRFTDEGALMGAWAGRWTEKSVKGALWAIRAAGVWVEWTRDHTDTQRVVGWLEEWSRRVVHHTGKGRPGPVSAWGKASNEDWASWLLQGFEGIGPELATRIVERFQGVPLQWSVGERELREVEGIGPKKASKLIGALNGRANGIIVG